jgi:hypothetical protein
MREASKIGKYMGTSTEKKMTQKMVGINLSATAPDAFGAMERISILASQADPSHRSPSKKESELRIDQTTQKDGIMTNFSDSSDRIKTLNGGSEKVSTHRDSDTKEC